MLRGRTVQVGLDSEADRLRRQGRTEQSDGSQPAGARAEEMTGLQK